MKILTIFLICLGWLNVAAAPFHGCPPKSLQACCQDSIIETSSGAVDFITRHDDDMQGQWGGNIRAEVLSEHRAEVGDIFTYRYTASFDPVPMDFPVIVLQLKQGGYPPVLALEWRNDYVYVKHRYLDETGRLHGPTMAKRLIFNGSQDWIITVKYAADDSGFIKIYDETGRLQDVYEGRTTITDGSIALKYGLYSWRFVDDVTARHLRVFDCAFRRQAT